jgi:hypothetical protein
MISTAKVIIKAVKDSQNEAQFLLEVLFLQYFISNIYQSKT